MWRQAATMWRPAAMQTTAFGPCVGSRPLRCGAVLRGEHRVPALRLGGVLLVSPQRHLSSSGPAQGVVPSSPREDSPATLVEQAGLAASPGTEVTQPIKTEMAEPIEQILATARRREIMDRVGPQAERYLPTVDPNAFLLPDSRLEPAERKWQKIFIAVPLAVFACMLVTPMLIVRGNLPWLQQRAEEQRRAAENGSAAEAVWMPEFQVVSFTQMPDVLERPLPTLVLLFEPATFASKVFLPAFRDLSVLLRSAGIAVSVAALDLSTSPQPPDEFLWDFPKALAPHLQIILPRAADGESGIIDYDGRWSAAALVEAARRIHGPYAPQVPEEEVCRLDEGIERLRDSLFEVLFLRDSAQKEQADDSRRWRRSSSSSRAPSISSDISDIEFRLDFGCGLEATLNICEGILNERQS